MLGMLGRFGMSGRLGRSQTCQVAAGPLRLTCGFTLIEMLVVIGIVAVLIGASIGGYAKMTKSAEKAKAQELVSNVATALTALFQQEGAWPRRLARKAASGDGELDAETAYTLVAGTTKYLSLTTQGSRLAGLDRFGVVTPWATSVIKRKGLSAALTDKVTGSTAVKDHVLHYALDLDGDGIIEANVGGESVKIRATAAVWCIGKDGGDKGKPWPYAQGRKAGDIYSWTYGQTRKAD